MLVETKALGFCSLNKVSAMGNHVQATAPVLQSPLLQEQITVGFLPFPQDQAYPMPRAEQSNSFGKHQSGTDQLGCGIQSACFVIFAGCFPFLSLRKPVFITVIFFFFLLWHSWAPLRSLGDFREVFVPLGLTAVFYLDSLQGLVNVYSKNKCSSFNSGIDSGMTCQLQFWKNF